MVDQMAFAPEQHMQPAIAEPSTLMGYGLHPLAQYDIVGAKCPIAHRHPAAAQHSARPPLAHPKRSLEMGDGISLGSGRPHFFPRRSFSAELSYNRVTANDVTGWAVAFPASGNLSTAYLLGNMWYDLPTGFSVTPYFGGGIGVGHAESDTYFGFTRYGYVPGKLAFAYQLGAGVKFDASEDIALDLGYRYKSILGIDYRDTDPPSVFEDPNIHSHVLQAGLTFKF